MHAGEGFIDTAQVFMTGYDVSLSRVWREEEREWRKEDLDWREKERSYMRHDYAFMDQERQWRRADIEQRHLDNARCLWQKFVEKNRRDVEEKGGQLKALSNLAAILAGFAIVAFLEMQFTFTRPEEVPAHKWLLPFHGLSTALTVAVLLNCVVMCTLLLSSVLRTGKNYVSEEEEAEFINKCRAFIDSYRPGARPPAPARSFATQWEYCMEAQWRHALLLFALGLPLFCIQFALASWVKFFQSQTTAVVVSGVMGVTVVVCGALQLLWSRHLLERGLLQVGDRIEQEPMGLPFDWHLQPQQAGPWVEGEEQGDQMNTWMQEQERTNLSPSGRGPPLAGASGPSTDTQPRSVTLRRSSSIARHSVASVATAATAAQSVMQHGLPQAACEEQQGWRTREGGGGGMMESMVLVPLQFLMGSAMSLGSFCSRWMLRQLGLYGDRDDGEGC